MSKENFEDIEKLLKDLNIDPKDKNGNYRAFCDVINEIANKCFVSSKDIGEAFKKLANELGTNKTNLAGGNNE